MKCFDCSNEGRAAEAIGTCHHCSAGVCESHGALVSNAVSVPVPVMGTKVLPIRARLLFCHHCLDALRQPGVREVMEDWRPDDPATLTRR
jgi:hypothetical protein